AQLGATNRPFAGPGEPVEVRLRSCDSSPGFQDDGPDHVVTLVFKPLSGLDRRVVVLAKKCSTVDLSSCGPAGAISATCLEVPDPALRTRVDLDEGDRRLVFQFPDTDALLPPDGDDQTLTGPVAIAVTRAVRGAKTAPAPCGLVSGTC